MGASRNYQIEKFEAETGLRAATGKRADVLRQLSDQAFELVKIIEHERSGIRDGDGYWGGSDPLGGTVRDLSNLFQKLMRIEQDERVPTDNANLRLCE